MVEVAAFDSCLMVVSPLLRKLKTNADIKGLRSQTGIANRAYYSAYSHSDGIRIVVELKGSSGTVNIPRVASLIVSWVMSG